MKKFNVTFSPKSKGKFSLVYAVEATNGKEAQINAAIDMQKEGANRNDYKAKAQVRSAA
jgi:hypothetical protein